MKPVEAISLRVSVVLSNAYKNTGSQADLEMLFVSGRIAEK